jgi:hypothetical protein
MMGGGDALTKCMSSVASRTCIQRLAADVPQDDPLSDAVRSRFMPVIPGSALHYWYVQLLTIPCSGLHSRGVLTGKLILSSMLLER